MQKTNFSHEDIRRETLIPICETKTRVDNENTFEPKQFKSTKQKLFL